MPKPSSDYQVPAVRRAMDILKLISASSEGVGVSEISRQMEISKSVASGICRTLETDHFLVRNGAGQFRIGPGLHRLASNISSGDALIDLAKKHLRRVATQIRETGQLAILQDHEAVTIAIVDSPEELKVVVPIGKRRPLHCTALGKALLLGMNERDARNVLDSVDLVRFTEYTLTDPDRIFEDLAVCRERGYTVDNQEHNLWARCVGAPIHDQAGRVVAALSLTGPSHRFTEELIDVYGPQLAQVARQVSLSDVDQATGF